MAKNYANKSNGKYSAPAINTTWSTKKDSKGNYTATVTTNAPNITPEQQKTNLNKINNQQVELEKQLQQKALQIKHNQEQILRIKQEKRRSEAQKIQMQKLWQENQNIRQQNKEIQKKQRSNRCTIQNKKGKQS